ncbi:MAG: DHH family phosphoesterase [Candidatus Moranbacteria bacterium]|nr:DHH family phosphoesterase [Candidatus Moranbacteria bacterium]
MSLEPQEQFKNFVEKSKEVLILIPENPSGDAVGSAWALYFFLQKKEINATIAFSNHLSDKYSFLPKPEQILTEISGARDFVLSFNTTYNKISNVRTEESEGKLEIHLTPEKGTLNPKDFSFILAKFKYDLMVIIDSPDLEGLGKIYEKNPDLFFEVPIINIDHRSTNDNFGQINLVDITASSCSEILSIALEHIDYNLMDKTIADCLLTGIISATESFQKKNTTPKALLAAATLMDKGADQQTIIRWLYKTQPLHVLKLWGRAMANLNWDEQSKLVWTNLGVEDFVQSRSNPTDVLIILEKLQENYSEGKIFMALYNDTPATTIALLKSVDQALLKKIQPFFNGTLKRDVLEIKLEASMLFEAGTDIAKKIKEMGA